MQFHSSSFWDNHNCDLWVGTELQQEAALGDVLPGQEMGKRFLLGKQAQTQWLIKAFEIHCSVRTNLGREDARWDRQNFQKNISVFRLKQISVGISAKCMEGIQALAFHTHPTAGAGYGQLIWFETWFILSAKSCLKFSNAFIFFSGTTYFPGLKTAWEATDSSALKCDMARAGVILACLNIVITVGK